MNPILFNQEVLRLYPEFDSVYGPYLRKDGRKHVILNNSKLSKGNKKKLRTISYPKLLVEVQLGYRLADDETVDHINDDFTDNNPINLRILTLTEHAKQDKMRHFPATIPCIGCGKLCNLSAKQVSKLVINLNRNKVGPFCNRICSGRYGRMIQLYPDRLKPKQTHIFVKGKLKRI